MKCRVCENIANKIYETPKIPEYIWPSKKKIRYSKCKVFSCKKCYTIQLQKFTKKKIKSFYGISVYNIVTKKDHLNRINLIKKHFGSTYFKGKKIIDVGGGVNPIYNRKSVDIFDLKISKKNKKILKGKLYQGDIENKKIKKKYDIIFLLHTLEHFQNPLKALNNLKSILNMYGRIFIEVPNFDYLIKKNLTMQFFTSI